MRENQLSARETKPTRLTFGERRIKKIFKYALTRILEFEHLKSTFRTQNDTDYRTEKKNNVTATK